MHVLKNRKINIQKSKWKSSISSSRLLSLLLASGLNHRKVPLIPFTFLLFYPHLSLPTSTHCWDKPIHAWPVLSLSSSMLNKTCAPHAAALCFLQITATLPLSRLLHPSMVSVSSLSSLLSQQIHFRPFPFSAFSSCSTSFSVFPPPFFSLFLSHSSLPPSLPSPSNSAYSPRWSALNRASPSRMRAMSGWLHRARSQSSPGNIPPPTSLYSRGGRRSMQDYTIVFAANRHTST